MRATPAQDASSKLGGLLEADSAMSVIDACSAGADIPLAAIKRVQLPQQECYPFFLFGCPAHLVEWQCEDSGGSMVDDQQLYAWFRDEVLPLERMLTSYIRRNWRVPDDVTEFRQDIYEHALIGARRSLPSNTRAFLYTIARNHIINQARRSRVVSFEVVADIEALPQGFDMMEADRAFTARDELRHAQAGIEKLPPRCREVMRLRKIDGLSTEEAADRLGVTTDTVRQQLKYGMKALIDHMLGGTGKVVRSKLVRESEAQP